MSRPRGRSASVSIALDADVREVDLQAPVAEWCRRGWAVRLIDLWVAAMIPADVFDLEFALVGLRASNGEARSCRVDGLTFARGMYVLGHREVTWMDATDAPHALRLSGVRVRSIVARAVDGSPSAVVPVAARVRTPSEADLRRWLPAAVSAYPAPRVRTSAG